MNFDDTDTHWADRMPKMATVHADGASHGTARIVHRTIEQRDVHRAALSMMSSGGRGYVRAGDTYCELRINDALWMSDTHDERRDHFFMVREARGDVLIAGLGLGMVALACAEKDEVRTVTVLEVNPDVVALVEPALRARLGDRAHKLNVVCADAMTWTPPRDAMYDAMWWDIWIGLCTDDLDEHATLNRRYARRLRDGGYRDAWGSDILRRRRKHEQREQRAWRW